MWLLSDSGRINAGSRYTVKGSFLSTSGLFLDSNGPPRTGTGLKLERGMSCSGFSVKRPVVEFSGWRGLCLDTSGDVFGLGLEDSGTLWVFDLMMSGEGLHLGLSMSGDELDFGLGKSGEGLSLWVFFMSSVKEAFLITIDVYCCWSFPLSPRAADSLTDVTGLMTSEWVNSISPPMLWALGCCSPSGLLHSEWEVFSTKCLDSGT